MLSLWEEKYQVVLVPLLQLFHIFHLGRKLSIKLVNLRWDSQALSEVCGLLSFCHKRQPHIPTLTSLLFSRNRSVQMLSSQQCSYSYRICNVPDVWSSASYINSQRVNSIPSKKVIFYAYLIGSFWGSNEVKHGTVSYKAHSKHSICWPNIQLWGKRKNAWFH